MTIRNAKIDIKWVDVSPADKTFYSEVFEAEIFVHPIVHRFLIVRRTPNIFNRGMCDYSISHDIQKALEDGSREDLTDNAHSEILHNATSKDEAIKKANEHIQQYFNN